MENCYVPNNPNLQCLQSSNSSEVCWRPPSPSSSPDADKLFTYANLPPVQEVLGYHRIASPLVPTDVSGKDGTGAFSLTALDLEPLPGFFTLSPCTNNYSYKEVLASSADGCKVKGGHDMADVLLSLKHAVLHPGQISHGSCPTSTQDHYGGMRGCSGISNTAPGTGTSANSNVSPPLSNYYGSTHPTLAYTLHPQHQDGSYGTCSSSAMGSAPGAVASMGVFPMSVNVSMNMTMGVPAMGYAMDAHHPPPPHHHGVPWNSSNGTNSAGQSLSNYSTSAYSHGHTSSHHYPAGLLSPIQVTYNTASAPQPYSGSNNATSVHSANSLGNHGDLRPEGLFDWRCDGPTKVNIGHAYARSKVNSMNFMDGGLLYEPYAAEDSRMRERLGNANSQGQSRVTQIASYQLPPEISPTEALEDELQNQHQTDHTGQTSLGKANLCRVCGKTYARPSTLKTHMRTHTNERPYRCHACSKSFSQAANLTAHARTHTGEKPFRCQICDRRFSQSSSVTTHMRTHSGDRPYRCRMCKKAFSDSSTLTKHMRIHSGEKPYQCKLCMLRFSQSGNLNRHMRVHSSNS